MARKRNYINNPELLQAIKDHNAEVERAIEAGKTPPNMPRYIGVAISNIAERYGRKGNFAGYTYIDEMVADAKLAAVMAYKNFDTERGDPPNPLAYFTQVIKNAFLHRISREKKQVYISHKVAEHTVINGGIESAETQIDLSLESSTTFVQGYEDMLQRKKEKIQERKDANNCTNND